MSSPADSGVVPALAELSVRQREQAMARWRMLAPHVEQWVPLGRLVAGPGPGERTLRRWLAAYRAGGLAALARQPRADKGSRRMPGQLRLLIEGLALRRPAPTAATVHRQVAKVAAAQGWPVPSYSTVHAIIGSLDPALVTIAVEGTRRYQELYELICRREAARPNAICQADHTQLDLWVLTPAGTPGWPWLTVIEDDFSRAVAGYAVNISAPSALNTALALRQAIWRKSDPGWHVCGIPELLYTDHGSDFTSRHLEQVAADLKIHAVLSLPGQPRGRGKIERMMGTVGQLCLSPCPATHPAAPPTGPARHG